MPRGRAATYDNQRELILKRAAQLFARRGYPATSMNQVAEACNLSKASLYHYYRDKYSLLVSIAEEHVTKLAALVEEEDTPPLRGEARLRRLIRRIVEEYADAQDAHRVLTEEVKFLESSDRERILKRERQVVAGFARAVADLRPGSTTRHLAKPLTMLLFGMINWLFTWMKPEGKLGYAAIARIVADLFLGGAGAVGLPENVETNQSGAPQLPSRSRSRPRAA